MTDRHSNHETWRASSDDAPRPRETASAPFQPPGRIAGYEPQRRLGVGAYGEVWVAQDQNTGRRVAIKYFTHRSRSDPTLLPREIEKLVALSADRYVVQLLGVGWNADPPHFVMEYIEGGSLEDRLRREGPIPVAEAVDLFREIATGLSHAHGKGILHCDLKPANILLDQDLRPRLADFGQARLTSEPRPALGTLFYMAPEQADLQALPDARWDVYALGAIFYCMVTGGPPHRDDLAMSEIDHAPNLEERLRRYRLHLQNAPPPTDHRRVPGVDRSLAEIVDRCLDTVPDDRYPHVVSLLQDLESRDRNRSRRPLILLGLLGPLALLLTMALFAAHAYRGALSESRELARRGAMESNRFAAYGEAKNVANELEKRFRALANVAERDSLLTAIAPLLADTRYQQSLRVLANPKSDPTVMARARSEFVNRPDRARLDQYLSALLTDTRQPECASWLLFDRQGTMIAAAFAEPPPYSPIGDNFAYRTYFHGGARDLMPGDPAAGPLHDTSLSSLFRSTATGTWKVAIATPVSQAGKMIGVLAVTVELGNFMKFPASEDQCALLVDGREGDYRGVVLQHPLFDQLLAQGEVIPVEFGGSRYRVDLDAIVRRPTATIVDPFAEHERGHDYSGPWIASSNNIVFDYVTRDRKRRTLDTGLVLIIQSRATAANQAVENMARWLFREGMGALLGFVAVTLGMWLLVVQISRSPGARATRSHRDGSWTNESVHSRETMDPLR